MLNHHHQHHHQQEEQGSKMMKVCCLCGDVGFPDKLFSCNRCSSRYQHSYCSNYNGEPWEEICDWCVQTSEGLQGGGRGAGGCSRRLPAAVASRSEYAGERIKRDHEVVVVVSPKSGGGRSHGGGGGGVPSPRQSTRRYKLLKDVMC